VEHDSRPEVASLPAKPTVSSWLYHPFASGLRDGDALAAGAVLSSLNVFAAVVSPPSLSAVHASRVPVVSAVSVRESHPVVERMTDSGSTTVQLTVTLLVYHPSAPSVPKIAGVTTGGVGSPGIGLSGSPGAPGVTSSSAPTPRKRAAARRRMRSSYSDTTNVLPPSRRP
jgi:hypothetical protein